jgi:hypothetical protein
MNDKERLIAEFLLKEKIDPRKLIISWCLHWVTESVGFKEFLYEKILNASLFNIIARWVKPEWPVKVDMASWKVVWIELKVQEISRCVLMLIHSTKYGAYKEVFWTKAMEAMRELGYLNIRGDPRCWNLKCHEVREKYENILSNAEERQEFRVEYPHIIVEMTENVKCYLKKMDLRRNWKNKGKHR